MTICRTQIYCNFGPLLFNCNLAMQIWYWKIAAIWTLNKNMATQCINCKLAAFWTLNKCMAIQQHQSTYNCRQQLLSMFYRHIHFFVCPNWNSNIYKKNCIFIVEKQQIIWYPYSNNYSGILLKIKKWKQLKLRSEVSVIKNSLTT